MNLNAPCGFLFTQRHGDTEKWNLYRIEKTVSVKYQDGELMKSKWIQHKGQDIFFADYSNFTGQYDLLKAEIGFVTSIVVGRPKDSVPLLVDVRNTPGTPENVDLLKASAVACKPHVPKTAVVGVTGYRRMIMRTISKLSGMPLMSFDALDEAKDWLVL